MTLLFVYHISFNLLPNDIRLPFAAGISLFLIAGTFGSLFARPSPWRIFAMAPVPIVTANWIAGEALGTATLDLTVGVRFVLPMLVAVWVLGFHRSLRPGVFLGCCVVTLFFALVWVMVHPQALVGHIPRFAPFTGDEEGAHASSYIIAICAIAVHQLMLNGQVNRRFGWAMLLLAALLLLGNRVATPLMMLLNYAMLHVVLTRRLNFAVKSAVFLAVIFGVVAVLVAHEAQQSAVHGEREVQVERLGSGRIGTWIGRLELLSRRSPETLLFGTGPGSDHFFSPIWLSEKKDSHNDLLTVTIESGFVGLFAVLFFYIYVFRRLGRNGLPLFIFFFSGSMLSNGLINRPLISALFWFVAALVLQRVDSRRQSQAANAQGKGTRAGPGNRQAIGSRARPAGRTF